MEAIIAVFIAAVVLIAIAIGGMTAGSRLTGRCLRGSCGGPAVAGSDGKKIESCADCPNRKY
jgi:hypothetical protein